MAGRGPRKSCSTSELMRRQELLAEPFWRRQAFLEPQQKKALEDKWDARHYTHFSCNNEILNPACRDYFDRPRELPAQTPGLRPKVLLRPTWSLGDSQRYDAPGAGSRGTPEPRPLASSMSSSSIMAAAAAARKREAAWNDRWAVTHSHGNEVNHDSQKELFGRFVPSRSQRVLPHRVHGITKHVYPYHQYGNPDGADDGPTAAETLLGAGDEVPVPPLPSRGLWRLPQSPSASAPNLAMESSEPDATLDATDD